ncbi:helix-turn-helix domain-containing protein [Fumia xinanensis]|uniref:Helix-turn-helix transcriptional regulator n=1 Tax=Fumia xinanensis TaxID=2763659 RepID=A0A926E1V9_9FIRM|nr:helix-turn-helix transcriptional regulator [Fumia xinanensis]MBC8560089.1 helix-turn-helix transcriptional regulator [Fumia xinanensis]
MTDKKREITKKTADRIRYFRKLLGMSQEQLAFAAGMNPAFLGHIEQGLKCPTIDTLQKICSALGISLSQLLDFDRGKGDVNAEARMRINRAVRRLDAEDANRVATIVEEIVRMKKE